MDYVSARSSIHQKDARSTLPCIEKIRRMLKSAGDRWFLWWSADLVMSDVMRITRCVSDDPSIEGLEHFEAEFHGDSVIVTIDAGEVGDMQPVEDVIRQKVAERSVEPGGAGASVAAAALHARVLILPEDRDEQRRSPAAPVSARVALLIVGALAVGILTGAFVRPLAEPASGQAASSERISDSEIADWMESARQVEDAEAARRILRIPSMPSALQRRCLPRLVIFATSGEVHSKPLAQLLGRRFMLFASRSILGTFDRADVVSSIAEADWLSGPARAALTRKAQEITDG